MIVTAGKTNVTVYFYIVQDASATSPGEPVTGLLFSDIETGGSASYMRQGTARSDFTLVTLGSASVAHTDGGFILVDDTNMPGLYRCDVPDAAFATGVDQVFVQLVVAASNNAVVAPLQIDLTDVDFRDSVRGGMTALPNAAADAAGGLTISDAGGLDLDAMNVNINDIETVVVTNAAGVDIAADIIALKAETVLIVADTNELQTDDVPGLIATAQADLDTITGAAGALLDTTATSAALVDDTWDEVLTGGTHNVTNSSGRRLRALQESSGYGGYIHVDTLNGAAGTTDFENGTEDNPVLTWADALTLNTSLGFNQFHIFNGSTITLTASSANFSIIGDNYTLALASQSIASAYIEGAVNLSGISSGASPRIHKCKISGNTSLDTPWLSECRLGSTITLLATGGNFFQSCYATTGTVPIIDLDAAIGAQTVCLTPLTGGIQFNNSKAGDLIHLEGGGEWVLDSTCTAGTFEVAGQWRETDNSSGMTINRDLIATEVSAVLVDTGTTLPATLATIDTVVDGIQTDLDNGTDGLGAIKGDTAAILTDTGTTLDAALAVVDSNVDAILVDTGTTIPGTITTLQSDTDDIQTRLPAALVGGRMDADMGAISTSTVAADNLEATAEVILIGSATGVTLSITQMSADGFTEATDDHFNGKVITWSSGALLKQSTDITAYDGATQTFTFTAITEAPAENDTFTIT